MDTTNSEPKHPAVIFVLLRHSTNSLANCKCTDHHGTARNVASPTTNSAHLTMFRRCGYLVLDRRYNTADRKVSWKLEKAVTFEVNFDHPSFVTNHCNISGHERKGRRIAGRQNDIIRDQHSSVPVDRSVPEDRCVSSVRAISKNRPRLALFTKNTGRPRVEPRCHRITCSLSITLRGLEVPGSSVANSIEVKFTFSQPHRSVTLQTTQPIVEEEHAIITY